MTQQGSGKPVVIVRRFGADHLCNTALRPKHTTRPGSQECAPVPGGQGNCAAVESRRPGRHSGEISRQSCTFRAAPKLIGLWSTPTCQGRNPTLRRGHTVRPAAPCRQLHSGPGRPASISSAGSAASCGAFGSAAGCAANLTTHSSPFRANPRPSSAAPRPSHRGVRRSVRGARLARPRA